MARTLPGHRPSGHLGFADTHHLTAALPVLRDAGRRVPDDVRVVGFDDAGLAATTEPPLTTVRQPLERISEEMVRLLVDVINGRTPLSIAVPTSLVLRNSSPA